MTEEKSLIEGPDQVQSVGAVKNGESNGTKNTDKLHLQLEETMNNLFSVSSGVLIRMVNSLFEEEYEPENTEISLVNKEFVLEYCSLDIIKGDLFLRL